MLDELLGGLLDALTKPPSPSASTAARPVARGRRIVLGLAGPPAAGKSTLARHIVEEVNRRLGESTATYLPLDGFHLSNAQLDRIGLRHRKGSPPTFDVWGYAALLHRVVPESDHEIYVPDYDRELHEPVAARHVVLPHTRLIVSEGNYLALDEPGWRDARAYIDDLWYVDTPDEVRESRLIARQLAGGLDADAAGAWVESNDRPNGELVKPSAANCARVVAFG